LSKVVKICQKSVKKLQKVVTIGQTLESKTRKTGKFERMVQRYEKRRKNQRYEKRRKNRRRNDGRNDEKRSYDEDDGDSGHL
jgi:hypothetical protein